MGLFSRKSPDLMTEAGNLRAAEDALENAEKARRNGDHEYAQHCEAYATEARIQAEMSRRQGR